MKFLSVCSGIEAASVAWNPLGWEAVAFSEIEPFPCALLAHHYPNVPNLGDMTKFKDWPDYAIDLLCGGTPCQSFSVAGLRKGLDDPRGNLMLTFGAIAAKYRPQWLVWENVPGVLSSNGGADFGAFLGMLGQLGYGFAYRVLDAQYFGVAQRRRRVFVVACLGDWRSAAAVLFERHSLQGHPAPSRKTGQEVTPAIRAGAANGGAGHGSRSGDSKDELIVPVAKTLSVQPNASHREDADTYIAVETLCVATGQAGAEIGADMAPTLNCNHEAPYALYATTQYGEVAGALTARHDSSPCADRGQNIVVGAICKESFSGGAGGRPEGAAAGHFLQAIGWSEELTAHVDLGATLQRGGQGGRHDGVMTPFMQVRRLTPEECEALQGFPRGYTDIRPKGKPTADGPRYKALGNSWAVPNVRWIGERIKAVEHIRIAQAATKKIAEAA